jgi:hypothetical protein
MKRLIILTALAALTLFGVTQQAKAEPSVLGIAAFSPQAMYMSLNGYLRWQYFEENNVWISKQEAGDMVRAQEDPSRNSVASDKT